MPQRLLLACLLFAVALGSAGAARLAAGQSPPAPLTERDRADIQDLVSRYARALAACAAEEFADLFARDSGYFASGIRGQVVGRDRLIALVRSERHCTPGPAAPPRAAAGPTVVAEPSVQGAVGRADLGAAGRYEDEYVRTPGGWRFASRHVVTPAEVTAGLTARDAMAIRRLAGTDFGEFDDVYVAGPDGTPRFRSSGVALGVSADGITGRAVLKHGGGEYQDVYVKAPNGVWRFKSRVYVPADPPAGSGAAR